MSGPVKLRWPLAAGSLLSILVLGSPAAAQDPSPAIPATVRAAASALRSQALQGTKALDIVRSLTVEVGPRPAGSKAYDAAVVWGLRTLKDLGFSNVHAEKATVPHWVRGEESGEITAPYPQPVHLAALGGSVGTPDGGIEVPVIGVSSLEAVDKLDPRQANYFSSRSHALSTLPALPPKFQFRTERS